MQLSSEEGRRQLRSAVSRTCQDPQNLSRMQLRELHGDHCARKEFKTLKPAEFSPYRRSAAVESLEPLQPPLNSDATYAVVTASPESVYTRTDETRRSVVSTAQSNQPTIVRRTYSNFGPFGDRRGCRCLKAVRNSLPAGLSQTDIGYEQFKRLLKTYLFWR